MTVLFTERLRLEPLSERHLDGLHAMNSRPEVMRYITGEPEMLQSGFIHGIKRMPCAFTPTA